MNQLHVVLAHGMKPCIFSCFLDYYIQMNIALNLPGAGGGLSGVNQVSSTHLTIFSNIRNILWAFFFFEGGGGGVVNSECFAANQNTVN